MSTLKDIIKDTLFRMGELHAGIATGGSSTTLVDSSLKGADGDWKNGILLIDKTADGLAPQGEMVTPSGYARQTGTITFADADMGGDPEAGDYFSLGTSTWGLQVLRNAVNFALSNIGDIPKEDTSLTTAASKTEYTLPTGVTKRTLKQVWIERHSVAIDSREAEMLGWRITPGNSLVFSAQPDVGYTLRLVYIGAHDTLWVYGDTLSQFVHIELATAATAYWLLKQKKRRSEGVSNEQIDEINDAMQDYLLAQRDHPIWMPPEPDHPILTRDGDRKYKYGPGT